MTTGIDHSGSGADDRPEDADHRAEGPTAPVVDRAAAFADTSPPVPRRFFYWLLGAAAVLGLGGLLLEHLFSSTGLNPVPQKTAVTTTTRVPSAAPVPGGRQPELGASLTSFMGLTTLRPNPAPSFALVDQAGQATTLADEAHKVVVLTFFNGPCDDICPVLASEIRQADADLGANAANAEFLTVNTDPSALAVSGLSSALAQPGMSALSNWRILTGPLVTMNATWKAYGVAISVMTQPGGEAHNDVIYFIDPQGRERYRATPFANESRDGTYSLPSEEIARWASGIATYADKLVSP
jgi:cytochrome oxidase Cu insertion factor (SCO1/SenC/PrrC family)